MDYFVSRSELVKRYEDIDIVETFLEGAMADAFSDSIDDDTGEPTDEEAQKIDQAWIRLKNIIEKAM
jgi:hypothetical protein